VRLEMPAPTADVRLRLARPMAPDRVLPPFLAVLARVALDIAREDAHNLLLVLVGGRGDSGHLAMTVEHLDGVRDNDSPVYRARMSVACNGPRLRPPSIPILAMPHPEPAPDDWADA
jgi:hypothetical protein